MTTTVFTGTYKDFDFETSLFTVNGAEITAVNMVAEQALQATLLAAVTGVSIGNQVQSDFSNILRVSNQPSQNAVANREAKWIVSYEDNVTFKKYTTELPVADLALRDANSEVVYTIAGGGVDAKFGTLQVAFEAYVKSVAGNAVTILEIRSVGRNT